MIESSRGRIAFEKEKLVPVMYKGEILSAPLRLDLLVGGLVIVECKATTPPHSVYEAQLLKYLRLTNLKLGLLINFGHRYVKNAIARVVNGLDEGAKPIRRQESHQS